MITFLYYWLFVLLLSLNFKYHGSYSNRYDIRKWYVPTFFLLNCHIGVQCIVFIVHCRVIYSLYSLYIWLYIYLCITNLTTLMCICYVLLINAFPLSIVHINICYTSVIVIINYYYYFVQSLNPMHIIIIIIIIIMMMMVTKQKGQIINVDNILVDNS